MRMLLNILRRASSSSESYWQAFFYEPENSSDTVATALKYLNEIDELQDAQGNDASKIRWDCNCFQKKCGACAMVINGKPALACDKKLSDCGKTIFLEPLRKFPVVADLIVDRSIMYENLKVLKTWLEDEADIKDYLIETVHEASRCLQCGCCLEVCPNFCAGDTFKGMAAAVPITRLLSVLPSRQMKKTAKLYRKYIYEGCGKSLACRDICPAKIDIEGMLVHSNAIAVWKKILSNKGDMYNEKT